MTVVSHHEQRAVEGLKRFNVAAGTGMVAFVNNEKTIARHKGLSLFRGHPAEFKRRDDIDDSGLTIGSTSADTDLFFCESEETLCSVAGMRVLFPDLLTRAK